MKKFMFIALSAISIVVVGCLSVACSSDSNTPDATPQKMVQKSAQEQSDDANWADFYAAVDSLNTEYALLMNDMTNERYIDPGLTEFRVDTSIVNKDIHGALHGVEFTRTFNNGNLTISLPGTTIMSAVYSYYKFKFVEELDNQDIQFRLTIRNLNSIYHLNNGHICTLLGKQHNQLLVAMIESNFDSTNLTYAQVIEAFINKYEQLFTPVPRNIKTLLSRSGLDRGVPMTINVQQANTQFRNATLTMSMPTMRNYTDDYLNIVNAAQVDEYDKMQMCVYAGVAYYSGALWIVQ